jgi:hypothetical protein
MAFSCLKLPIFPRTMWIRLWQSMNLVNMYQSPFCVDKLIMDRCAWRSTAMCCGTFWFGSEWVYSRIFRRNILRVNWLWQSTLNVHYENRKVSVCLSLPSNCLCGGGLWRDRTADVIWSRVCSCNTRASAVVGYRPTYFLVWAEERWVMLAVTELGQSTAEVRE